MKYLATNVNLVYRGIQRPFIVVMSHWLVLDWQNGHLVSNPQNWNKFHFIQIKTRLLSIFRKIKNYIFSLNTALPEPETSTTEPAPLSTFHFLWYSFNLELFFSLVLLRISFRGDRSLQTRIIWHEEKGSWVSSIAWMHHKEQNYFLIFFRFLAPVQLKMDDGSFFLPLSEHILGGKK